MVVQQLVKAIGTPIGLFYKSLTGAPASQTPAQLLAGAKGAAPVVTLPQQSAYQKIASGVYGIKDAASIELKSSFTDLSSEVLNLTGAPLGAYLMTEPKLKNLNLAFDDNSLKNLFIFE